MGYLDLPESALRDELPTTAPLGGRTITLGVCGSISAPKAQTFASLLVKAGVRVRVVMSEGAQHFIGTWAFRGMTGEAPYVKLFEPPAHLPGEPHIEIAHSSSLFVGLPASATLLSRLARGEPADAVSLVAMNIHPSKWYLAPAMSTEMWEQPVVQENVSKLEGLGARILGPAWGRLASGRRGRGRLLEPLIAADLVKASLGRATGDYRGLRVVISAGGSQEAIDPVRVIANRSSGRQGHALAEAARDRGAEVVLVTANPGAAPFGLEKVVGVTSHAEFERAVHAECQGSHAYIGAAAIADFRVANVSGDKIKRAAQDSLRLELEATTDIVGNLKLPAPFVKVAFAAETSNHLGNAEEKYRKKGVGMVVLNDVSRKDAGFAVPHNRITVLTGSERHEYPAPGEPPLHKYDAAWKVLDHLRPLLPNT